MGRRSGWTAIPGYGPRGPTPRRHRYVSLGGGRWLPVEFTAVCRPLRGGWPQDAAGKRALTAELKQAPVVSLVLAYDPRLNPPARVLSVEVHRPEDRSVTRADLLRVPLTGLVGDAVAANVVIGPDLPAGSPLPPEARSVLRYARTGEPARELYRPGGRRRMDARYLAEIARTYVAAIEAAQAPTKAVAEHFRLSEKSAGKYVAQARKAGMLTPAPGPRRKGGELTPLARQILENPNPEQEV